MAVVIINRQRARKIDGRQFSKFVDMALRVMGVDTHEATIVFVSNKAIIDLNRRFRGKDYATDVLSFPTEPEAFEVEPNSSLGDVVISVERAAEQAKQNRLSFSAEVRQLILHGLLHLCGYDHETDNGEMNRLELRVRKRLGI